MARLEGHQVQPGLLYKWHRVFLGGKAVGWCCWPQTPLWSRGCEWIGAIYPSPLCAWVDMSWVPFNFTVRLDIAVRLVSCVFHTTWGRDSSRDCDTILSPTLKMKAADFSETFVLFYRYIRHTLKKCLYLHAKSTSFLQTSPCVLTTWDIFPHARKILRDSTSQTIIVNISFYLLFFCSVFCRLKDTQFYIPTSLCVLLKVWQNFVIIFYWVFVYSPFVLAELFSAGCAFLCFLYVK